MSEIEVRTWKAKIKLLRTGPNAPPAIRGYASVFNELSDDLGGFREMIMPGAFDRVLSEQQDVRALFNHDPSALLGRTKSNTLKLAVDERGLYVTILPIATPTAAEVIANIRAGNLDGMSFAFRTVPSSDTWRTQEGEAIREVNDLNLYDVSVVTYPAYPQTEVGMRGLQVAQNGLKLFRAGSLSRAKRLQRQRAAE